MKHTPGPWRAEPEDLAIVHAESGAPIATFYSLENFPCLGDAADAELAKIDEELRANAVLLAAAPELLAALRMVKENLHPIALLGISRHIDNAIAKATLTP